MPAVSPATPQALARQTTVSIEIAPAELPAGPAPVGFSSRTPVFVSVWRMLTISAKYGEEKIAFAGIKEKFSDTAKYSAAHKPSLNIL
jgi:hypothetical protein